MPWLSYFGLHLSHLPLYLTLGFAMEELLCQVLLFYREDLHLCISLMNYK